MKPLHFLVLLSGLLALSACGFKPMYAETGTNQALQATFAGVKVAPVPGRLGQVVRNHLLDRINPYGSPSAPDYVLKIALEQETEGFGFRSDESITRESYVLEVVFQLLDANSGKVVFEDLVRSVHTYDVVQSDFANFSAQQDAEARTALQVSELITARLGMFFAENQGFSGS